MVTLNSVMLLNQPFISAASGLMKIDQQIFVVADDENFLGRYDLVSQTGCSFRVFSGELPENKELRKKAKADIESIILVPNNKDLLLIPSGSTFTRDRGALIDVQGNFLQEVSFTLLYQNLHSHFPELNIEGGLIYDQQLFLFQRGNGPKGQNALISLPWKDFLQNNCLKLKVQLIELGSLGQVKLTFTDATNFGKNFLFLAVAEDSASVYLDGKVSGAVLGILSPEGVVLAQKRLGTRSKPEGISFCEASYSFYLVTDDDDRLRPAQLLLGELPLEWKSFLL